MGPIDIRFGQQQRFTEEFREAVRLRGYDRVHQYGGWFPCENEADAPGIVESQVRSMLEDGLQPCSFISAAWVSEKEWDGQPLVPWVYWKVLSEIKYTPGRSEPLAPDGSV